MKLLRIVLLTLLVVAAALFGVSFLLPPSVEVEQAVFLKLPPEKVYPYLNNPMEWQYWSMLNKNNDPSMIHLYGGPMEGKGARMQWSGDRVGNGLVVFTESVSPSTIIYKQTLPGSPFIIHGSFSLAPVRGGTQLVWRQQTALKQTPIARLMGALQQYRMQQEQEQGLNGLKALLQGKARKKTT